jgi:hypothetical protein
VGKVGGLSEYYLEQLLTLVACGAFAVVAILMYRFNMLKYILDPMFFTPVLVSGFVLMVLVVIRGWAVWKEAGEGTNHHHHDHSHDECCDHDHGSGGHTHGNMYWRVLVLAFPILLFLMGLPNGSLSKEWLASRLGDQKSLGQLDDVAAKDGDVVRFDFAELNTLAVDAAKRAEYEGRTVSIKGQMRKVTEKEISLFTMKMTCCAADMVPLQARIVSDFTVLNYEDYGWVEATGKLQFAKKPGKNEFIPVIRTSGLDGLRKVAAE